MRALALKAMNSSAFTFPCIVAFAAFTTARVSLAVSCLVAVLAAVEALQDLVLWYEFFDRCIM